MHLRLLGIMDFAGTFPASKHKNHILLVVGADQQKLAELTWRSLLLEMVFATSGGSLKQ